MFFERPASLRDSSVSASASRVNWVRSTAWTVKPSSAAVLERVARPADAGQGPLGEVVGVDDQRAALGQVAEVGLQGRRVHRDQDVGTVAGRQDVVVGEVQLEGRDAGQRALWGADLGGKVREGREVVSEHRGFLRETVTGQLHSVAGVACDADNDLIQLLHGLGHAGSRPPRSTQITMLRRIVGLAVQAKPA